MLDSGPLISLYDSRDDRGEQVRATLQKLQELQYPLCITHLTVAETHTHILYNVGYKRALEFLRAITDGSVHVLEIEAKDAIDAIDIIEKYRDQGIAYTDAVSMSIMKRVGIQTVLSYDHHFWALNFHILPEIYSLRDA